MNDNRRHPRKRSRKALAALIVTIALGVSLIALPAQAGGNSKHKHKHHRRHVRDSYVHVHRADPPRPFVRVYRPGRFVAPVVIRTPHVERYRPYYRGRVHYGPHRHDHYVYYFPLWSDDRYAYRPHYYCSGELYHVDHLAYRGPRVSFRIAF